MLEYEAYYEAYVITVIVRNLIMRNYLIRFSDRDRARVLGKVRLILYILSQGVRKLQKDVALLVIGLRYANAYGWINVSNGRKLK